MNPFDYLNAINDTKQNVIEDSDNPELAEKLYPPYLVNRGLSFFIDTVYLKFLLLSRVFLFLSTFCVAALATRNTPILINKGVFG